MHDFHLDRDNLSLLYKHKIIVPRNSINISVKNKYGNKQAWALCSLNVNNKNQMGIWSTLIICLKEWSVFNHFQCEQEKSAFKGCHHYPL